MRIELYYYIKKNGMTIKKFAEILGISREYLGLIITNKRDPSLKLAKEIQKKTNGAIKARYFMTNLE